MCLSKWKIFLTNSSHKYIHICICLNAKCICWKPKCICHSWQSTQTLGSKMILFNNNHFIVKSIPPVKTNLPMKIALEAMWLSMNTIYQRSDILFHQRSKSSESRFHEKFVQLADIRVENTPINYTQTT